MSYSELARQLNTTPQNINTWLKYGSKSGRKIPKERMEQLATIFPDIPCEYFQKELTQIEKLEVKKINYISFTDEPQTREDILYDAVTVRLYEKEQQKLKTLDERGVLVENGYKVIYKIADGIELANHWIAYEDSTYENVEIGITPNKIYRLYHDRFNDELVIMDDLHRDSLIFLAHNGDFIIVEKL